MTPRLLTGPQDKSLEEVLALLGNLGIEAKIRPALAAENINWGAYLKNPSATLKLLASKGRIKYPDVTRFLRHTDEEVRQSNINRFIIHEHETLQPGQTFVLATNSGIFKGIHSNALKKAGVITGPAYSELPDSTPRTGPEALPYRNLRRHLDAARITDAIVGYRVQGNKDVKYHDHPLTAILDAQIMFKHLRRGEISVTDYSGTAKDPKTGTWLRGKDGARFTVSGIPSKSGEPPYSFTLFQVPAYQGPHPTTETIQAAYNTTAPKHDCGYSEWSPVREHRYVFGIDSTTGILVPKPVRGTAEYHCRHINLALHLIGEFLEAENLEPHADGRPKTEDEQWHLLNPLPIFSDRWESFYMKLLKDTFKEKRKIDSSTGKSTIIREPLNDGEMNSLIMKRMIYINDSRNQHYR